MTLRIELVLLCIAAAMLNAVLFPVLTTALARFARVQIAHVGIGSGPKVLDTHVGTIRLELRLFPFQSWVKAVGHIVFAPDEVAAAREMLLPGRVLFREASRVRRALVFVLAPRHVPFLIAAAVLGVPRAWDHVVRGVLEVARGAVGPFSTVPVLLHAGVDLLVREGVAVVLAVALTKTLAFSVLTLPGDISGAIDSHDTLVNPVSKARVALLGLVLLALASWLLAMIVWILSPGGAG